MKRALPTLTALIALLIAVTPALADVTLKGPIEQGALVVGHTDPAAHVSLDGKKLMVSPRGYFAFGFDRDHDASAKLTVTTPDGVTETKNLAIAPRAWNIQSITGVASKYVSPPPADLIRIKRERELKAAARPCGTNEDFFAEDFIWPASGPISGIFGSQRIFNGENATRILVLMWPHPKVRPSSPLPMASCVWQKRICFTRRACLP